MLHDPARHEALQAIDWNESLARETIVRIVADTESRYSPDRYWPTHPLDADGDDAPDQLATPLYHGACGVIWALRYLQAVGAAEVTRSHVDELGTLLARNRAWLGSSAETEKASYMMGNTPILLLAHGAAPTAEVAGQYAEQYTEQLAALIEGNLDHPARELMWGSPGTALAALFLHERTGEARWADLFRRTAAKLWSQLLWSDEHGCQYWTQDLYGREGTYLDAVHGFVATTSVLIRGRQLFDAATWNGWERCIVNTITRTASREGNGASWRAQLLTTAGAPPRMLMQFCHGAPGFVICLADMPGTELEELLVAAGEATWAAGPLTKGSNLCHGTGGNGYAFLKLYRRTGNDLWLARARAFAMHGIAQTEAAAVQHGRMRYSLWTGDLGFAIYLHDCIHRAANFPTLDVFDADPTRR